MGGVFQVSFFCVWWVFFVPFFDRTYEIPLSGGTPYDTGVDLDPSVSLKGNNSFTYILTCFVFLPRPHLLVPTQNQVLARFRLWRMRKSENKFIVKTDYQFSGHCWKSKNETVSRLVLWEPSAKHHWRSRGRPAITFIDQLESDTGLSRQDHGQQTGMGQTYKISAGAPERDR